MKADKSNMLPLALTQLQPEQPAPFPLFLFLPRNNRMVPVRREGDSLGRETYERLIREKHEELWVPKSHENEVAAYLEYLEKTQTTKEEAPLSPVSDETAETDEAANQVKDLLSAAPSLTEENAETLSGIALKLLEKLRTEERIGALPHSFFRALTNAFLAKAAETNSLAESVLALRSFQSASEHSVFAGSAATIMAVAAGNVDPEWIANLVSAATFHDIGLIRIHASVLAKKSTELSPEERAEYESHVRQSVALLESSEDEIPPEVIRMVAEHHERPDGTGFPKGLKAAQMIEGSRYLFLANELDRLCGGERGGTVVSPKDALLLLEIHFPDKLRKMLTNH